MRDGDVVYVVYAVLRWCRRCLEWLPVDDFRGGRLCHACARSYDHKRVGAIQLTRALALTDKARAFLAAERMAV